MPKSIALWLLLGAATAQAQDNARESWIVTVDLWGNPVYQTLELAPKRGELTGTLDGDALRGSRDNDTIRFVVTDAEQASATYAGKIEGDAFAGTVDMPDTNDPKARASHAFSARRIPARPPGPSRRHEYAPDAYSNEFSSHRAPVLTIWPKDSVHTTTLDSGGVDENGVTKALFGNPQTGPFFVAGA